MRKLFSLFAAVVLSMTYVFAQDGWTWTESDIYPSLNTPFSEVKNVGSIQFIGKVSLPGSSFAQLIISNNGSEVVTKNVMLNTEGDNITYSDDESDNRYSGYDIANLKVLLYAITPAEVVDGYTYTLHIPAGKLKNSRGQLNSEMNFTYHQYTPTNTTMNYRFANDWQGEETLTQGVFAFDAGEGAFVATDAAGSHLNKPVSLLEVGFEDATISHVEYIYVDHFYNRSITGSFEKENGKFVSHIHPALRFDATTQEFLTMYSMTAYELTINAWTGTYVPGSLPTYHNVFSPNAEDTNFDLYVHVQSDELEGWHGKLMWGNISTSVIDNGGRDSAYLYNAIADLCVVYKETFELDKADPWAAIDAHHPLVKDDQLAWLNDCEDVEVVENGMTSFDMNLDRTTWSIAGMGYGWSFPFIFFDNDCLEPGTHWHVYVLKTPRYGMDINLTDADFVACGVIGHGVKEQNHDGMHSHIHEGSHANPQEPTDYYTTFYDGLHTTIITSANTTAYAAKIGQDAEGTFVTLNAIEGNIIPQGVAVLLKAEGEEVIVEHYFDEEPAVIVPDNDLQGVDFTTAVSALPTGTYYTLAAENDVMAFYKYNAANMNANKAYLQLPAGAPAPRRICFGTNTATGMENTEATIQAEKILRDGQLYIIKNGNLYDVQGALVK